MVICASPEGEEVSKRPRKVVARVSIDRLEKSQGNPDVDGENVEIVAEHAVEERPRNRALCENHDLEGMSVFSGLKVSHHNARNPPKDEIWQLTNPIGAENSWCSLWMFL